MSYYNKSAKGVILDLLGDFEMFKLVCGAEELKWHEQNSGNICSLSFKPSTGKTVMVDVYLSPLYGRVHVEIGEYMGKREAMVLCITDSRSSVALEAFRVRFKEVVKLDPHIFQAP
jgi:hypothetical protein